jgi:hypothetical protein
MREESIVVTTRAERADGDLLHSNLGRVLGDQRSEVDVTGPVGGLSRQLLPNLRAYFVTSPADRGAEVDRELVGGKSVAREGRERLRGDAGGGTAPAGVNEGNNTRRMGDEHRDAIGDSHRERYALLACDVAVGLIGRAEPPLPAAGMYEHSGSMDLPNRCKPARRVGNLMLNGRPPRHHFVPRLGTGQAEGAGVPSGRERANPPTLEVGDYFFVDFIHRQWRRSSTRVIEAPSAFSRSSIRS